MNLIVSRHPGVIDFLREEGIEGEVVEHATPEQVRGRNVYGILPLHLAALADQVVVIDMPYLRPEQRGRELSVEEMREAGARLVAYSVQQM